MNLGNVKGAVPTNYTAAAAKYGGFKDVKKTDQRTVGNPKLSNKAKDYFEKLKEKYGDMDFVLVSDAESENAMKHAEDFVTGDKHVVVIDESTVEKMAADENYREQQEKAIDTAKEELQKIADDLANATDGMGKNVKGFGVHINPDGTTTFFAVMARANTEVIKNANNIRNASRDAEKAAAKAEAKRIAEKKIQEEKHAHKADDTQEKKYTKADEIRIEAETAEELLKKMNDTFMEWMTEEVRTPEEQNIGQAIDFTA